MNTADRQINVGVISQTGSNNTGLWVVDGKLVSSLPQGKTGNQLNGNEKIYLTNDGKVTLDASLGIEVKADQAVTIQNEIEDSQKEYQNLIDAHKKTANKDPQTKAAKVKFMQDNVFRRTLNAQPPIIFESSNLRNWIPGAIIQKHLGKAPTLNNTSTSDLGTPSATSTTTPSAPNNQSISPTTLTTRNSDTIAALMAQLNGTRISDVTAAPTTSGNNQFDIGFRKRNGSLTMVLKYPSLAKFFNNEQLEALNNLSQILESHKNSPINAVGEIYGFSAIRVHGANPLKYIKAKLKKTTFRIGLGRRPKAVAKSLNRAIDFYTDLLAKVTPANGADTNTLQFKQQFLQQLVSVNNAYMTRGAEGYVSNMIDTPPPTAIGTQTQATPIGQRASIS